MRLKRRNVGFNILNLLHSCNAQVCNAGFIDTKWRDVSITVGTVDSRYNAPGYNAVADIKLFFHGTD